jgi:hypothetical protein
MSYVMDLHQAHVQRIARLGGLKHYEREAEKAAAMERVWPELPAPPEPLEETRLPAVTLTTPAWKQIVQDVCDKHGFTLPEILGARRSKVIVIARHEAFYRLSTETTMSLPQIGYRMGGKDHTTVIHGIRQHKARMEGKANA